MLKLITWMEAHMASCSFKDVTGLACPGCGIQRSLIALLKGHILESILFYPALLPLIGMFGYLGAHLVFKFRNGGSVLKIMYISNMVIILSHYIMKFFIHQH